MSDRVRELDVVDLSAPSGNRGGKSAQGNRRPSSRRPPQGDFDFVRKQAARRARIRRNRLIVLGLFVLLVVAVFGVRLALMLGSGAGTFYPGVSVNGIALKGYDMEAAAARLGQIDAQRLQQMQLTLLHDGQEYGIDPAHIGATTDAQAQLDLAWEQGREGNIFKRQSAIAALKKTPYNALTTIAYDEEKLRALLVTTKGEIDYPAQDAAMDFDPMREEKFYITEEKAGLALPLEDLFAQCAGLLGSGKGGVINLAPLPVEPVVRKADLEGATTRLFRATTPLGESKAERIHNIKLALTMFNGMVVAPGERISFNEVTGARGEEEGYQNAGVIKDDEIVDGPGGGVCQVSTTMYQAVVCAGLEVVKRSHHSIPVSYVTIGTDAVVAYDYMDLAFINNTDAPIYLLCEVSGSSVVIAVYGKADPDGITYKMDSEEYETIPAPALEIKEDKTGEFVKYADETFEKKRSRPGHKVRSFRVDYDKDGNEISRKLLRDDYYQEVVGIQYVGVTQREAATTQTPAEDAGDAE